MITELIPIYYVLGTLAFVAVLAAALVLTVEYRAMKQARQTKYHPLPTRRTRCTGGKCKRLKGNY